MHRQRRFQRLCPRMRRVHQAVHPSLTQRLDYPRAIQRSLVYRRPVIIQGSARHVPSLHRHRARHRLHDHPLPVTGERRKGRRWRPNCRSTGYHAVPGRLAGVGHLFRRVQQRLRSTDRSVRTTANRSQSAVRPASSCGFYTHAQDFGSRCGYYEAINRSISDSVPKCVDCSGLDIGRGPGDVFAHEAA